MRRFGLVLAATVGLVPVLEAQDGYTTPQAVITGVQARRYSFESGFATKNERQFAFPIALLFPMGQRLSVDIGTSYATTTVNPASGSRTTVHGFTDTQVRASYTFGKDAVVTTMMVNLPTGKRSTAADFASIGSIANNFLPFPVNSYYNGTSVTGGLAGAVQSGGWNLGLAGSLRWNAEYSPFTDAGSTVRYKPGVEGRIRAGVDRLLGKSRFAAGFTFSTFGDDQFSGTGTTATSYSPGNRYIGELSLASPVGSGTVSTYVWDFYRSASSTSTSSINKENIFTAGVSGSFPMGKKAAFQPIVEGKFWSPNSGSGQLYGAGASLRLDLASRLSFSPGGRFDTGKVKLTSTDPSKTVNAWGLTGLFRYDF